MIALSRRVHAAFSVLALLGAGCSRELPPSQHTTPPPFHAELGHKDRLVVRPDIAAKFESERAGISGVAAKLVGYGRMHFAPDASYAVRVPYTSFVDRVHVAIGSEVKRGQPLAELRSSEIARLRGEASSESVNVSSAKQQLERVRRLLADGTASERETNEAAANVQMAEARLAAAKAALSASGAEPGVGDLYTLKASATGRVLVRTMDPGERVSPDDTQPPLVIGDPTRLVVHVSFPERDAVFLKDGLPCTFTLSAVIGETFEGTIGHVVGAVDPATRSAEAICTPKQPDSRLSSEMAARVEVVVERDAGVIVPRSAVLLRRDEYVVFVRLADGVVERRTVELGPSIGDRMRIAHGLQGGEEVLTRGAVLLDGELDRLL